jgi:hypothetical protein
VRDKLAEYFIENYDEERQSVTLRTPNGPKRLPLKDPSKALGSAQSSHDGYNPFESSWGGDSYDNDYGNNGGNIFDSGSPLGDGEGDYPDYEDADYSD